MKRTILGTAVAAAPFLMTSPAQAQFTNAFTAPRNATVDASGARRIEVEASAGLLRIEGRTDLRQVQIRGTARASEQRTLPDIRLIAERRGDIVFVKAEMPDGDWGLNRNNNALLDLVIEVPQGMNAHVSDGSGEIDIRGVGDLELKDGSGEIEIDGAASVRVSDGSGNVVIKNVRGDVHITDGSGDIVARDVSGTFTVDSDGSGGIFARDIRGSVVVEVDGSGNITANNVGSDFRVDRDGSGEIRYDEVKGKVDIPDRKRLRSRRDRDEG
ncbi:MAG TPA: hypothetical protein VNJ04_14880 [Gemmatimonadaceae bacterium]|nr:hypothetical protein [Gemmatimonadaceae bacterium]